MTMFIGAPPVAGYRLDWPAYFHAFEMAHGPSVDFESRLLYEDGWMYAYDHRGPEYPPPEDRAERMRLRKAWINIRRAVLAQRHADLKAFLALVRVEMLTRPLPLHIQHVAPDPDSETGFSVTSAPLTDDKEGLGFYDADLARMTADLAELDRKMKAVEENP